ncbi:MAG: TrkH family potassium uptake protein [Roseovarius sp.]|nr:TrkH family potassium uptake protein [Roseovarius sp.]
MIDRLLQYPLIMILAGLMSMAMFIPALHALWLDDHEVSRGFLYSGLLGLFFLLMSGFAMSGKIWMVNSDIANLGHLFLAYTALPLFLAIPFHEAHPDKNYLNAYFEMVSCMTTTGATLFSDSSQLQETLHLWRGLVGWLGGLLLWISAAAVLAPLNIGGFEVTAPVETTSKGELTDRFSRAGPSKRLAQFTLQFAPVYIGLTGMLCIMLLYGGEAPLVAVMHAMSTISTSGISSSGGMGGSQTGMIGECMILVFMLFALSRATFTYRGTSMSLAKLHQDHEFRTGLIFVFTIPFILFLSRGFGLLSIEGVHDALFIAKAFLAVTFTTLSFLSTTGFESAYWAEASDWLNLETPGLILLGLSIIGGGVATTAGGVKLLRVYALALNGRREIERLVYPSSLAGAASVNRHLRRQGAFVAWIFFMMFALSLSLVSMTLAAMGHDFEHSIILAVAALSTTGPLTQFAPEVPIDLYSMSSAAKLVFNAAMILGRFETLAIIALFNPDLWRN